MRVGVADIGTNSTRLLVADVADGRLAQVERRSTVTRLGEGLEASGRLDEAAQERVLTVLDDHAAAMAAHGCESRSAVMTSAVRDAVNGEEFRSRVERRTGLRARTISGDEEARLTFLGATAARRAGDERLVVIDVGGGSTEIVTGRRGAVGFHVSTQIGVVRHTERHLHHDPPLPSELEALARDAREELDRSVPSAAREAVGTAIAVAGTATSAASIDLGGYDAARVEGRRLTTAALRAQLERLAGVPLGERRHTPGLHPDRAPTIVAGLLILLEAVATFELDALEVSDRDILWGAALDAAAEERADGSRPALKPGSRSAGRRRTGR